MWEHTVLTEYDDKGTPFTKVIFGQESPYIPPSRGRGYRLLLRATLSHQWMGRGRKSEIHAHRQEWKVNFWDTDHRISTDSISAPFTLSYMQSLATSYIWFAPWVKTRSSSSSKRNMGVLPRYKRYLACQNCVPPPRHALCLQNCCLCRKGAPRTPLAF